VYGAFASLKEVVAYDDPSFQKVPPFMSSSKNWDIIRFDDVMMFKAEALIELGRQDEALPLINQIRARSSNSTALLKQADGSYTSHYDIETYKPGVNCTWTQAFAREALRWERRLEFATEGYHFFDLVRWGIAAETINAYFNIEKTRSAHLSDAKFTKGRDEYFPIPLNQINFSRGLYKQNTGW
jgi:starch-binding outer membrane protein, SusD/RagB family